MKRFENWLKVRDFNLHEEISHEDMARHDFDAMKYAQQTVKTNKERQEQEQAIKNLGTLKEHLPEWVGHDKHGAAKLKYIAAIIDTHGKDEFPHDAYVQMDDLHKVAKVLSKENIEKALGEKEVLAHLAHAVESNWDADIWPQIQDRHASDLYGDHPDAAEQPDVPGMDDHSHGDLGKHFTQFTVSHIVHLAGKLENALKEKHDQDDQHKEVDKTVGQNAAKAHGNDEEAAIEPVHHDEKSTTPPLGEKEGGN